MVVRPVAGFIGREDALTTLADDLSHVMDGRPRIVVISGETGVGKTRLVGELLRREQPRALVGACVPVAGQALPFAPLAQALRRLAQGSGRRHLEARPELGRLLDAGDADPVVRLESQSQLGLFQSILGLLGDLGRDRPVVFVVEDIHWADRSTLDLIRFLATNLLDERVLLVLTYRIDEVGAESPVRAWLAEVGRLPRVDHLALPRLSREETIRLAENLAGAGADSDSIRSIVARSDGNPLFTQHLVWHAGDGGSRLPDVLSDLLSARLATLSASTRDLTRAASVLARRASFDLLAATTGLAVEEVEEALVPAFDHHVLRLTDEDLIDFQHPAFREIAYAEMLPTRRARLHRAAAQALAAEGVDREGACSEELARHWQLAGDLPRALDAALAGAFAAERIPAFADAYAGFVRALNLLDRVPRDVDRVEVLRHAAHAARILGDDAEAVRLLHRALDTGPADDVRAAVLEELGYAHLMAGRGPAAEDALRQAQGLLRDGEDDRLAAKVHAGLGLLAAMWSRYEEADAECGRALSLARAVGARREEGTAHNALGAVASAHGCHDEAAEHLRTALEIAKETGDPDHLSTAYVNLSHVLGAAEHWEEAVETCRDGLRRLTQLELDRQSGAILTANGAESLLRLGRYEEAEELVRQGLANPAQGIAAAPTLLRAAQVSLARGDIAAATRYCDQARAVVEVEQAPLGWSREVAEISAEAELWAGHAEAAFAIVIDELRVLLHTDEETRCSWLFCLGLRAVGDLVVTRRQESSRRKQARMLTDLLRLAGSHPVESHPTELPAAAAWMATAGAETSRARGDSAPQLWVVARLEWAALGRPFEEAYSCWREAEARLTIDVDADAVTALRAAHAQARRLGLPLFVEEIEQLGRWYRVELFPQDGAQVTSDDASYDQGSLPDYGLTPRELQVLAGLAAGCTNQELGKTLGMSVKTASVHVSNILRKLDVTRRAEAARVAYRLGITS